MTPAVWTTVRDRAAPRVQGVVDRAFALSASPAPYDILNCADVEGWERPEWTMAVFGLLPIESPSPGAFPWASVNRPGTLVVRTRFHEEHYRLFAETRPAGWTPKATIVRSYTHLAVVR